MITVEFSTIKSYQSLNLENMLRKFTLKAKFLDISRLKWTFPSWNSRSIWGMWSNKAEGSVWSSRLDSFLLTSILFTKFQLKTGNWNWKNTAIFLPVQLILLCQFGAQNESRGFVIFSAHWQTVWQPINCDSSVQSSLAASDWFCSFRGISE